MGKPGVLDVDVDCGVVCTVYLCLCSSTGEGRELDRKCRAGASVNFHLCYREEMSAGIFFK